MGNSPSETKRKHKCASKRLFPSWWKKQDRKDPEKDDIYGLIDVSKLMLPKYDEEPAAMIKQKHERRRKNCGKIFINEEVPQKIIDLLIKLSYIESDDVINNIAFRCDFYSYYKEGAILSTPFLLLIEAKMSKDITAIPIILLLDFITVKKRLHVRSKEVDDFCTTFDSYLFILRQIEYCQNQEYVDPKDRHDFAFEPKLPITKEEIHSIIEFFYEVLDKNHLSRYKEYNTDLDDVAINQCLV